MEYHYDVVYTVWCHRSIYACVNLEHPKPWSVIGPDWACKVRARFGLGLYTAGSGFCGPGLVGRLGVWIAGLAQKPGQRRLGVLGYVVKAWARAHSAGLGLGPLRP
jgi:hypothetical protein